MDTHVHRQRYKNCISQVFTVETLRKKFPITRWLPKYRFEHLQGDVIAGLTVGLTVIPQGLALAHVAGLPPQYGLYTSFMGCFVYMFFGTSKDITVGPTAIMSLLVGQFGRSIIPGDATYAIILTLCGGIVQLLMGILHIGFVIDYISHPVIDSFTTAAAITIAEGQVKNWFGLRKIPRDFIHELYWTLRKLPETRLWDFVMGLACICLLILLKFLPRIPFCCSSESPPSTIKKVVRYILWLLSTARNAIVVLLAASTVVICLEYHGLEPFSTTANVTAGMPPFKLPDFTLSFHNHTYTTTEIFSEIGIGFAVIPILGLVETMAIGKAFAKRNGYKIDANQELIAVGAANILSSFVSSYPVTGSFSRTAVNSASGVRTPAGGIFTGLLVILSLIFLTPYFHLIPDAALATIIIMAVSDMVSFSLLIKLWRVKKIDLVPWIVTFLLCLLIGVEWGILVGIGLSLLMLLYPWGRPVITETTDDIMTSLNSPLVNMTTNSDIMVLSLNQGLVFPGVEYVTDIISTKAMKGIVLLFFWNGSKWTHQGGARQKYCMTSRLYARKNGSMKSVVLDCCHVANIDYTTVEGFSHLLEDFQRNDAILVWTGLQLQVLDVLQKAKLLHTAESIDEAVRLINDHRDVHLYSGDEDHQALFRS